MTDYRNIDSILIDARTCYTIADAKQPVDWSGMPEISDEVSLDTDEGAIMVEVTGISTDKNTLEGKVTHGYYPEDESAWLDVGVFVKFSQKKIAGIHKSKSEKEFTTFLLTSISAKKEEEKASPKIDWEAKKKEWLSYLDLLHSSFTDSLTDYVKRGMIKIRLIVS